MDNNNEKVVIGKRQILREIKENNIAEIIIASDAETQYIQSLIIVAKQNNVNYSVKGTMMEISQTYGIDVPSGSVGVLKN